MVSVDSQNVHQSVIAVCPAALRGVRVDQGQVGGYDEKRVAQFPPLSRAWYRDSICITGSSHENSLATSAHLLVKV